MGERLAASEAEVAAAVEAEARGAAAPDGSTLRSFSGR